MIEDDFDDDGLEEDGNDLSSALDALFGRVEQGSRKHQASGLQECPFAVCPTCCGPSTQTNGYFNADVKDCPTCDGVGYVDVPVDHFTFEQHRPGSEVRVAMMTARYNEGRDIWTGQYLPGQFALTDGDAT